MLPWMMKLEARDFYIPEKYEGLFYPYKHEQGLVVVDGAVFGNWHSGIVKENKKPGRNQPCHCGSGKKYKKCCFKKDSAGRSTV